MSLAFRLASAHLRRSLAAASLIVATGGLVLLRAQPGTARAWTLTLPKGVSAARFSGSGLHGSVALSHGSVLAGAEQEIYARVLTAADRAEVPRARAPISLAIVLDASGSMAGEKMEQAKDAIIQLVSEMRDDDQIALVRYSDEAQVLQPLAPLGEIRGQLTSRIHGISAGGGTSIPLGLAAGLAALNQTAQGRVERLVLVSDGLDSTGGQAEAVARNSVARGVTISSMGIGLDFDESYMSRVALAGHGNFAFVADTSALASFFHRELDEAAGTTIQRVCVRLQLPTNTRFVSVSGADAEVLGDGSVALTFGSLFAGDERRAIVRLATRIGLGETAQLSGTASWTRTEGGPAGAAFPGIAIRATSESASVAGSIDRVVMADAASVRASERQLEAAQAYARGDSQRASALIDENLGELGRAAAMAPAPAARALAQQRDAYGGQRRDFGANPGSAQGQTAAKRGYETDSSNLNRSTF